MSEINGPNDITEEDVQTAHDFAQLCQALAEYAEEREQHKRAFDKTMLESLAQSSASLYHQLSVVHAQTQEEYINSHDIASQLQDEGDR